MYATFHSTSYHSFALLYQCGVVCVCVLGAWFVFLLNGSSSSPSSSSSPPPYRHHHDQTMLFNSLLKNVVPCISDYLNVLCHRFWSECFIYGWWAGEKQNKMMKKMTWIYLPHSMHTHKHTSFDRYTHRTEAKCVSLF